MNLKIFYETVIVLAVAFCHVEAISYLQSVDTEIAYVWKTKHWSSCLDVDKKCGSGTQHREITCHDSEGDRVDDTNCDDSLKPPTSQQCFIVCRKHRDMLRWKVGEWSPCVPHKPIPEPCISKSITGTSSRKVTCTFGTHRRTVDSSACEHFRDRPEAEMGCSLDCPQNCVRALKNVTCRPRWCPSEIAWKKEVSDVIVTSSKNNDFCSNTSFTPVCPSEFQFKMVCQNVEISPKKYTLRVGEWTPCEPTDEYSSPDDFTRPRFGMSQRDVTCLDDEGEEVELKMCNLTFDISTTVKLIRQWSRRACVMSVDCGTSPWSEWHVLKEGCITSDGRVHSELRERSRMLLKLPIGPGARPCPPLRETRVIMQDLPACYKNQWFPLEWSECEIHVFGHNDVIDVVKPTCGSGLQYRNITCRRATDQVPVPEDLCKEQRPPAIQRCKIPCKRDCQVGHWSHWGPCTFPLLPNFLLPEKEKDEDNIYDDDEGYRIRNRDIIVFPTHGGDPCPHVQELDTCEDLETHYWRYGDWGPCVFYDRKANCGDGTRTRSKTCVNIDGEPANTRYCSGYVTSYHNVSCHIPCPNDCVLSDWSAWLTCNQPCFDNENPQPVFRKRKRTMLAVTGAGGAACANSIGEDESDCNDFPCEAIKWTTGSWGQCRSNDGRTCGAGVQMRNVTCVFEKKFQKELCKFLNKPETTQPCHVPCPVDCVVTSFSDWSSCDNPCNTSADATQYKRRYVIRSPQHGGRPCPDLITVRSCSSLTSCSKPRNAPRYQWNEGEWTPCVFPGKERLGYQLRNVSCLDTGVKLPYEVEPYFCVEGSDVPSVMRSCEELDATSGCVLSTWTPWSECGYEYNALRRRSREVVGSPGNARNCPLGAVKLREKERCPVISPSAIQNSQANSDWTVCILDAHQNSSLDTSNQPTCGDGNRYMFKFTEMGPVIVKDLCLVDCPTDCQMSQWSDWSECNVPCGKGFRQRTRTVITSAANKGRPCPFNLTNGVEIQTDVCHILCANYYWLARGWTECQLTGSSAICGNGTQSRNVRCIEKWFDKKADKSRCDPVTMPSQFQECRIHCPGECVLSPWTEVVKCDQSCSGESVFRRTVIRQPSPSESCPSDLEMRIPCTPNSTCFTYNLTLGQPGSCILLEGSICGAGVLKTPLICRRSDGRQVDTVHCEKKLEFLYKKKEMQEPESKPCYVPCPEDCVMSQWSVWDESNCKPCSSNATLKSRTRYVLQKPNDAGRGCPEDIRQEMTCHFSPCFHWKFYPWSECDLGGADCGVGIRRRVVECVRFDGLLVDKSHCLMVNVTFSFGHWIDKSWLSVAQEDSLEEVTCRVPCLFDCVVSEWSDWSSCHKNCRIGQKVGYQTSTRRVLHSPLKGGSKCPKHLIRTKPCWSEDCNFYRWKLKNNSLVCEGAKGMLVEGGCIGQPLPCEHWCERQGGNCNTTTGLCHCKLGHQKIMSDSISAPCPVENGPRPPANHSAPTHEIRLKYYPDDNQVSFWMYAMISIGTAFVIFVGVTVYLMCRSSLRQRSVSVERQQSLRRRIIVNTAATNTPPADGSN